MLYKSKSSNHMYKNNLLCTENQLCCTKVHVHVQRNSSAVQNYIFMFKRTHVQKPCCTEKCIFMCKKATMLYKKYIFKHKTDLLHTVHLYVHKSNCVAQYYIFMCKQICLTKLSQNVLKNSSVVQKYIFMSKRTVVLYKSTSVCV